MASSFVPSWSIKHQSLRGHWIPISLKPLTSPSPHLKKLRSSDEQCFLNSWDKEARKSVPKTKFPYLCNLGQSEIKWERNSKELLCRTKALSWTGEDNKDEHSLNVCCVPSVDELFTACQNIVFLILSSLFFIPVLIGVLGGRNSH